MENENPSFIPKITTGKEVPPASRRDLNVVMGLVIGALFVIGVALISLVIQYFADARTSYRDLLNQVNEQKIEIVKLQMTLEQIQKHQKVTS